MKKTLLTIVSVCAAVAVQGQSQTKPAIPRDAALEAKVEKTLAKMTLEEKIGQMLELNLDVRMPRWIAKRCALFCSSMADLKQR